MMETRMMETLLLYVKDRLTGDFQEIKKYMEHDIHTERSEWSRTANKYRTKLGLTWDDIKDMDRKKLKSMIKDWDKCQ